MDNIAQSKHIYFKYIENTPIGKGLILYCGLDMHFKMISNMHK
jgi:hypothetical protein